jgi:hypothetical protein
LALELRASKPIKRAAAPFLALPAHTLKDTSPFLMKWAILSSRDTLHYLTLFSKVKLLIGTKKSALIRVIVENA